MFLFIYMNNNNNNRMFIYQIPTNDIVKQKITVRRIITMVRFMIRIWAQEKIDGNSTKYDQDIGYEQIDMVDQNMTQE